MTVAEVDPALELAGLEVFEPLDIATDRCKGCELCVDVCPKHVPRARPSPSSTRSATTLSA